MEEPIEDKMDQIAVAPPRVRPAHDARDTPELARDPSDPSAKLDVALDETFPSSDAPANTRPGTDGPAPSSGFDEEAERKAAERRD